MATKSTKVGHGLAKVLGIKLDQNNPYGGHGRDPVTRGESLFSVSSADTYTESEPRSVDWIREQVPNGHDIYQYFRSLLPFLNWITRYNSQWLIGDLVAGITVGCVVVPQSMAYAKLAELPPEFGLYSSFMGVLIYWFFATSKDITIGPVAVMSTIVGNIILDVQDKLPGVEPYQIASALAVLAGGIIAFLGFARLGFLVELIPLVSIAAFLTGSALNIAVGQVPNLLGLSGFDPRAKTYHVVVNILKHLGTAQLDAAMGLTALFLLYLIRTVFNQLAKRQPQHAKLYFFINTLRTAFVILLYTMISWLVNRHRRDDPAFKILKKVPRGFKHAGAPRMDSKIISAFASHLPATVIVLLIEHISISKSFGRINNYKINPSQELVAIGVTNLLGPFLGAYPATGSFSRTAIKSKAGVRTPFAGVITAIIVLLALYALTAVFFYIPSSSLAAVIIHAVGDLITPPNTVYQFWRASPWEVPIFFAGVIVTIFSTIDNGIYVTVTLSAGLFGFRLINARGSFLGKVHVHSVVGDHLIDDSKKNDDNDRNALNRSEPEKGIRNLFLPIDHLDGTNPAVQIVDPYPGVFIYRFNENLNYPNVNHYTDILVDTIFAKTRRTDPQTFGKLGDRPWNDPGPRRGVPLVVDESKPTLKAIILDFSAVNNIDVTVSQTLLDVRNQLDRYTKPEVVEWHFAGIKNRWTKRALVAAGFGTRNINTDAQGNPQEWKPIFSVADIGGHESAARWAGRSVSGPASGANDVEHLGGKTGEDRITSQPAGNSPSDSEVDSIEKNLSGSKAYGGASSKVAVVQGLNMPLFHADLTSALQSAIAGLDNKRA